MSRECALLCVYACTKRRKIALLIFALLKMIAIDLSLTIPLSFTSLIISALETNENNE